MVVKITLLALLCIFYVLCYYDAMNCLVFVDLLNVKHVNASLSGILINRFVVYLVFFLMHFTDKFTRKGRRDNKNQGMKRNG